MIGNSWKTRTAELIFKIRMKLKMLTELEYKVWEKKGQEIIYIEIPKIFMGIFL